MIQETVEQIINHSELILQELGEKGKRFAMGTESLEVPKEIVYQIFKDSLKARFMRGVNSMDIDPDSLGTAVEKTFEELADEIIEIFTVFYNSPKQPEKHGVCIVGRVNGNETDYLFAKTHTDYHIALAVEMKGNTPLRQVSKENLDCYVWFPCSSDDVVVPFGVPGEHTEKLILLRDEKLYTGSTFVRDIRKHLLEYINADSIAEEFADTVQHMYSVLVNRR